MNDQVEHAIAQLVGALREAMPDEVMTREQEIRAFADITKAVRDTQAKFKEQQ